MKNKATKRPTLDQWINKMNSISRDLESLKTQHENSKQYGRSVYGNPIEQLKKGNRTN
jgi:hypothetical protein